MFAQVLPDVSEAAADTLYTYFIPPFLRAGVVVGTKVLVPLGTRQVAGYVFACLEHSPIPVDRVRAILAVQSSTPAFTADQASLAQWLAERYVCSLADAVRPCLVEIGGPAARRGWVCTDRPGVETLLADPQQQAVLAYLRAHPGAAGLQVQEQFGDDAALVLDGLCRDGLIRPAAEKRKAQERTVQVIRLVLPPDEMRAVADTLLARAAKQADLLRWAAEHQPETATAPEVAALAGVSTAVVNAVVEKGWLCRQPMLVRRNPWTQVAGRHAKPPELNPAQRVAVDAIIGAAGSAASFLLFGVTGSGKTEIFLHAIAETLAQGRQAIVLVPEISLTTQAMALYHGRFPGQVAVLHSRLSTGERFDEWQRIASGAAEVVLGARSAIFAPCPHPGLIIIDEEHESSYKQETSPRYHAKVVALERGRLHGAPVVLASATPSLESMREAELGRHTLLCLPERIADRPLPPVKLVDLRRMTRGAQILSAPLREAISKRLEAGEQMILFLNRRGFAHTLLCRDCGRQENCPHCAVPLTFHQGERLLRCHHCDHQQPAIATCPECKGVRIAFRGIGTERLEQEVQTLWPQARIGRLDRDTTARKGAHHEILGRFSRAETDILIGTQMVTKGFDFPRVTLVGVIMADTSLGVPDFRAPERTFQLLTQVAGRAGRGDWAGEVLVQTYQPEHYAIRMAMRHDYTTFYQYEVLRRGEPDACWPPLSALVNVQVHGESEEEVKATAAALARRARELGAARLALPAMTGTSMLPGLLEFVGEPDEEDTEDEAAAVEALLHRALPAGLTINDATPCPLSRLRGRFRYHVVLRGQDPAALRKVARALQTLPLPKGIVMTIDVDPLSLA